MQTEFIVYHLIYRFLRVENILDIFNPSVAAFAIKYWL